MNSEAATMWRRARRALLGAERLVDDDPDGAASRAYYAAFHAVSALFVLRGKSFSRHSAVETAVHRDLVRSGEWSPETGAAYTWLMNARMKGDYGAEAHVTPDEAREALHKARLILREVQRLSPEGLEV